MLKGSVSPADKSLKIPAREARSERKILLPHSTFTVIPLIIELIPSIRLFTDSSNYAT